MRKRTEDSSYKHSTEGAFFEFANGESAETNWDGSEEMITIMGIIPFVVDGKTFFVNDSNNELIAEKRTMNEENEFSSEIEIGKFRNHVENPYKHVNKNIKVMIQNLLDKNTDIRDLPDFISLEKAKEYSRPEILIPQSVSDVEKHMKKTDAKDGKQILSGRNQKIKNISSYMVFDSLAANSLKERLKKKSFKELEIQQEDVASVLQAAVELNDIELVELLLKNGVSPYTIIMNKISYGTLFRFVLTNGNEEMIDTVSKYITKENAIIYEPLLLFSSSDIHNYINPISIIIEKNNMSNAHTIIYTSPLHLIIRFLNDENKKKSLLEAFLNKGIDVNIRDSDGFTPLHIAAMMFDINTAEFLLDHGADKDISSINGQRAEDLAGEIFKKVLSLNSRFNLQTNDYTSYSKLGSDFMKEISDGNVELIKKRQHDGEIANNMLPDGKIPLEHALKSRNKEIINIILKSINTKNAIIYKPYVFYKSSDGYCYKEYYTEEFDFDADINQDEFYSSSNRRVIYATSPLHILLASPYYYDFDLQDVKDSIKGLLEKGINPNICDNAGFTPLHIAAIRGDFELAELLINYGANREVKSSNKLKPKDLLPHNASIEIKMLLENLDTVFNRSDKIPTIKQLSKVGINISQEKLEELKTKLASEMIITEDDLNMILDDSTFIENSISIRAKKKEWNAQGHLKYLLAGDFPKSINNIAFLIEKLTELKRSLSEIKIAGLFISEQESIGLIEECQQLVKQLEGSDTPFVEFAIDDLKEMISKLSEEPKQICEKIKEDISLIELTSTNNKDKYEKIREIIKEYKETNLINLCKEKIAKIKEDYIDNKD